MNYIDDYRKHAERNGSGWFFCVKNAVLGVFTQSHALLIARVGLRKNVAKGSFFLHDPTRRMRVGSSREVTRKRCFS